MHSLTTQHVKNVLLWRLCDSYSILQEDYFNRFYSYVIPFWLRKKLLAPYLTQSPHSILYVKPKLSLYSPTRARNEFTRPIFASLRQLATQHPAPFEETLQRWRTVGNTVSNLTVPRFEHQTSLSRGKHISS